MGTDYIFEFSRILQINTKKSLSYVKVCSCKFGWTSETIFKKRCGSLTLHILYYPFIALGALYFKSVTNHDKFLKGKYCKMKNHVFLKAVLL